MRCRISGSSTAHSSASAARAHESSFSARSGATSASAMLATQMLINGMLLGSSPQCLQNRYQFITNDNFVNADNECFVMSGKIDEIYCKL
jgi:hypothetical protein